MLVETVSEKVQPLSHNDHPGIHKEHVWSVYSTQRLKQFLLAKFNDCHPRNPVYYRYPKSCIC